MKKKICGRCRKIELRQLQSIISNYLSVDKPEMSSHAYYSEDSAETDSCDSESWEDEDDLDDKFKTYFFEYVERDYNEAIRLPRQNKKLRPEKVEEATERRRRRNQTEIGRNQIDIRRRKNPKNVEDEDSKSGDDDDDDWTDDEDYDSDGSCEDQGVGPPLLRVVPSLRGVEAMEKLLEWETTDRLRVLRDAGADIKSKSCYQAYQPARMGSKFKMPGPWLSCATQHYSTNCYAKAPTVEEDEPIPPIPTQPPPPPKIPSRKYAPLPVRKGCQTCPHCCYWNFEAHAESEIYYQDYLDRVTFVKRRHEREMEMNKFTAGEVLVPDPDGVDAKSQNPLPSCSCAPSSANATPSCMTRPASPLGKTHAEVNQMNHVPVNPSGLAEAKEKYAAVKSRYLLPRTPPLQRLASVDPALIRMGPDPIPSLINLVPKVQSLPLLLQGKSLQAIATQSTGFPRKITELDRASLPKTSPKVIQTSGPDPSEPSPAESGQALTTEPSIASISTSDKGGGDEGKPQRWISPTIKKKQKGTKTMKKTGGGVKKKKDPLTSDSKKFKKVKKSRKTKSSNLES